MSEQVDWSQYDTPSEAERQALTPETYPAECTIDTEELRTLYDELTSNEDWRPYTTDWPPTDYVGNVYPIWFTETELNTRGELVDDNGNNYSPFTGNCEPVRHPKDGDKYCNCPLSKWRNRYPNIRYCGSRVNAEQATHCHLHSGMESAESVMKTGLHATTIDHYYEKLGPWERLVGWGTYESLLGRSIHEFDYEYKPETFDFSDCEQVPPQADEDGTLTVKVAYPTEHLTPSLYLYVAAMMTVQMITVQPRIMYENEAEGERMMAERSVEHAQLTAPPSEHDSSPQTFETIESWQEHHLNKSLSRVIRDHKDLLKMGGVTTDPEDSDQTDIDADEIVVDIEASPDGMETAEDTGTNPNSFGDDYTAQSEKIAASVEGEDPEKPPEMDFEEWDNDT